MTSHAKPPVGGIEHVMVSSELSGVCCRARIRNATKGAIKLFMDSRMIPGSPAEVTFAPGFKEPGTVLYSRRDGNGFSAVISFNPADGSRREERTEVSDPCVVLELGIDQAVAMQAQVVNVSRSGLGLVAKRSLPTGSLVSVTLANAIVIGEVRHCAPTDQSKFRIGLSIEHQTPRRPDPEDLEAPPPPPLRSLSSWIFEGLTRLFGSGRPKALFPTPHP